MTTTLAMAPVDAVRVCREPIEAWVAAAQAGSRDALEFVLEAIEHRVYILAWRLTGDPALAEDVAQETLLKICRNLNQYRCGTNLWAWIYRIVVNQAHDLRPSRHVSTDVVAAEPVSDAEYDPVRQEQVRRVMEAMRVLTPRERQALVLIDIEGLSSREASRILGCLAITARTRAAQARKKVRRELVRYYPELKEDR
jgi:RNA polymerase sigma-70 factor (ECF subfamily)